MFDEESEFFKGHQAELVRQYGGKFIVIKGREVLGAYDSTVEALKITTKAHELGTFMIQQCKPGPAAYTVTISTAGAIRMRT